MLNQSRKAVRIMNAFVTRPTYIHAYQCPEFHYTFINEDTFQVFYCITKILPEQEVDGFWGSDEEMSSSDVLSALIIEGGALVLETLSFACDESSMVTSTGMWTISPLTTISCLESDITTAVVVAGCDASFRDFPVSV